MHTSTKPLHVQTYQTVLYDRALHPEHFAVKGRRSLMQAGMDLEAWIGTGSHVVRLQHGRSAMCEYVVESEKRVPETGVAHTLVCAPEHDFERTFDALGVNYIHSMQAETLPEGLFDNTLAEMRIHTREQRSLVVEWTDATGRCLSAIDLQKLGRELHVQSYHLVASGGLVIRSQSIFEAL